MFFPRRVFSLQGLGESEGFGVVSVRDILRLMTAYVVANRNMFMCESSTQPELHGWIGGEDLVYEGHLDSRDVSAVKVNNKGLQMNQLLCAVR